MSKQIAPHDPEFKTTRQWERELQQAADNEQGNFFETLNDKLGGVLVEPDYYANFEDLHALPLKSYPNNCPWAWDDGESYVTVDAEIVEPEVKNKDEELIEFLDHRMKFTPDFNAMKYDADLQLVFVYGTLKQGFCNHRLLENATYLGRGETRVQYSWLKRTGFPVVVKRPRGADHQKVGKIVGEVYACDLATMANLDALESNGYMYQREQVAVCLREQHVSEAMNNHARYNPYKPCWMYIGCEDYWRDNDLDDCKVENFINTFRWER